MGNVRLSIPHRLGRDEALRRIRARCAAAEEQRTITFVRPDTRWWDDGGTFAVNALGQAFRGQLSVGDDVAEMTLHVPGVARLLTGRIASLLTEEAESILNEECGSEPAAAASRSLGPRRRARLGAGAQDAVIGVVAGYSWPDVSVWANSLAESGFAGDRVLIALDVAPQFAALLEGAGYTVFLPSTRERLLDGDGFAPLLVERFHLIASFLASTGYRYVVITDVRDVVFQSNPSDWIEANLDGAGLLASSEGLLLGDEWWGSYMLASNFGQEALERVRNHESRNAGVIAGTQDHCRRICRDIVRLCTVGGTKPADQAAYNLLLGTEPWATEARTVRHGESWACQAGTVADPRQIPQFHDKLVDVVPRFDGSAIRTPAGEPYAIVHQYDRVPEWRALFESRFR